MAAPHAPPPAVRSIQGFARSGGAVEDNRDGRAGVRIEDRKVPARASQDLIVHHKKIPAAEDYLHGLGSCCRVGLKDYGIQCSYLTIVQMYFDLGRKY